MSEGRPPNEDPRDTISHRLLQWGCGLIVAIGLLTIGACTYVDYVVRDFNNRREMRSLDRPEQPIAP